MSTPTGEAVWSTHPRRESNRAGPFQTPEMGTEMMGTMPSSKCCPEPAAAAVGQAASCLKWTQAAAAWTANP
eukprot:2797836-Pyramimonas_sp.AAC.1